MDPSVLRKNSCIASSRNSMLHRGLKQLDEGGNNIILLISKSPSLNYWLISMYDHLKEHDSTTVNSFKVAGIQCSHSYHDHHSQSCIIRKMHHFLGCKCIMDTLQELWMVSSFLKHCKSVCSKVSVLRFQLVVQR